MKDLTPRASIWPRIRLASHRARIRRHANERPVEIVAWRLCVISVADLAVLKSLIA